MTDITKPTRPLTSISKVWWPAKSVRALIECLFRPSRSKPLDPDHTSAHLLNDIGYHHDASQKPIVSIDRLW